MAATAGRGRAGDRLGIRRVQRNVSLFVQQEGARGPYAFPLTVVVTDAENVEQRLVRRRPAEARDSLPLAGHFDRKPKSLTFDPDSLLLARIMRL